MVRLRPPLLRGVNKKAHCFLFVGISLFNVNFIYIKTAGASPRHTLGLYLL